MAVADGKHIDLKPLSSRCFLRQQTLLHFVSLNSDELMGTSDISLELTLQTTIIPSRGGGGDSISPRVLHTTETGLPS